MDQEKNKGFYDIMKEMHDGCMKVNNSESAECITRVFAAHSARLGEFEESADYSAIFDDVLNELVRVADAAYDAGFDKEGAALEDTWEELKSSAWDEGLR